MNHNRVIPQQTSAKTVAVLIGSAAIAVGFGVVVANAGDAGQTQTVIAGQTQPVIAKPSGGTSVTLAPRILAPTVTATSPPSSPPTPFAAPIVRAPQSGAA
jgi:hypothetical protein